MNEEWRPIAVQPGYSVSSSGKVRRDCDGKMLTVQNERYQRVTIKKKHYLIHRLVAQAFIPNPTQLPQVNHIDGQKYNNHVANLEWCDAFHNMQHCERLGLKNQLRGEDVYAAKLTEDDVVWAMAWRSEGFKLLEIAKAFGVAESVICRICNATRWPHLGGLNATAQRLGWDRSRAKTYTSRSSKLD